MSDNEITVIETISDKIDFDKLIRVFYERYVDVEVLGYSVVYCDKWIDGVPVITLKGIKII
jgi:hypothetical protein